MLRRPRGLPVRIPAWAWKWLKWRLRLHAKPAPKPVPAPAPAPTPPPAPKPPVQMEMYDDVNVSLIPLNAEAVAGYVDGKWPTIKELRLQHPVHVRHVLSIAVFPSDNAQVLDIEPGDATVSQAAAWVKRQHARGNKRPIVYTSASWGQGLVNALGAAGLKYGVDYLWWSAHYTYQPHLCSPKCGFGIRVIAHATQWTDKAGGKSLDESLCSAGFFS